MYDIIESLHLKSINKKAFSTVFKWSIVAPLSYVKKCIDSSDSNWVPYLHLYGWTRTGKNTLGKISLAINRKYQRKRKLVEKFIKKHRKIDHSVILNNVDVDYDTLMKILSDLRNEGRFKSC